MDTSKVVNSHRTPETSVLHDLDKEITQAITHALSSVLKIQASWRARLDAERSGSGVPAPREPDRAVAPMPMPMRRSRLDKLSPQERRVLMLLTQGLSNRKASRRLGVAEKTFKNHVHNILIKLDVGSRTEAAVVALTEGFIVLPDRI